MDSALIARSLERGFDTQGVSAELNPGVSPVHVITEESEHPELRYLRNERIAAHTATLAALAANFNHIGVRNPTGSGAIAVVTSITLTNYTAAVVDVDLRIAPTFVPSGGGLTGLLLDPRFGTIGTVKASCEVIVHQAVAAVGNRFARLAVPADNNLVVEGPVVLPPGFVVMAVTNIVNQELTASCRWVERTAEQGELTGGI